MTIQAYAAQCFDQGQGPLYAYRQVKRQEKAYKTPSSSYRHRTNLTKPTSLSQISESIPIQKSDYLAKSKHLSQVEYEQIVDELGRLRNETSHLRKQMATSGEEVLLDSLTGLPNRLVYDERIAVESHRWKRWGESLSVAIWNIDHLQQLNDKHGRDVGDRILKVFVDVIKTRIRAIDTFARIGGEDFALIMPDTAAKQAKKLNDELRNKLESVDITSHDIPLPITASVGIAEFQGEATTESVKRNASTALYDSKDSGRNRCTIYLGSLIKTADVRITIET